MDTGFVLVVDKKFGFSVRNQRNLSYFSGFRWFLTGNDENFYSSTSAKRPLAVISLCINEECVPFDTPLGVTKVITVPLAFKTENEFCPNPIKYHRFGRKTNEFCPNVYKKHRFGQKLILMRVELFGIFMSEKHISHKS